MIKHIWLDFSETIGSINKEAHNTLRYESYAKFKNKPVTLELIQEYEKLYETHAHSNSAIFKNLGLPAGFWSKLIGMVDPRVHYHLMDPNIPEVLEKMSKIIPVSIFSNIDLNRILPALGVDIKWFTHILSANTLEVPKPALGGFYKMIELSSLLPEEILYIGDHLEKDIIPAKKVGIKTGAVFEKIKEADYYFKDFKDILELIKNEKLV
ncbi:MAG: HAD family hydrolase [Patescibacteria group bacterium]